MGQRAGLGDLLEGGFRSFIRGANEGDEEWEVLIVIQNRSLSGVGLFGLDFLELRKGEDS